MFMRQYEFIPSSARTTISKENAQSSNADAPIASAMRSMQEHGTQITALNKQVALEDEHWAPAVTPEIAVIRTRISQQHAATSKHCLNE